MPSEWLVRFMRCHKNIPETDRKFIEILQKSRVPPWKVMLIFRYLRGSFRNFDFDEMDIGNMRSAGRKKHKNRDIQDLLEIFRKEQVKTPGFYYSLQVDEDDTVRSVFWTDLMGRNSYQIFGDYISFDTTFSTNRYNMPFAPIVGVNNHGTTVLFGCALLQNQKTRTFKWLFEAFLDAMGGKRPTNIITDQDKAMRKAIAAVFPDATHRFCYWHILENIKKNLSSYLSARGTMENELRYVIRNTFTPAEFEDWKVVLMRHGVESNEYLRHLFEIRTYWAPAYFKSKFYPFSSTTGRSESTNSPFKNYVLPKDTILNFFEQYQFIQEKQISKLDRKSYVSQGTTSSTWSMTLYEEEAISIFTRAILRKMQREMRNSTTYVVEEEQGLSFLLRRVKKYDKAEYEKDMYTVTVSEDGQLYRCSCCKFERDGLHCCHVFNIATRRWMTKLPESFILPRWTIGMDAQIDELVRKHVGKNTREADSSVRYDVLMSKMSQVCADMSFDEYTSSMFSEGVDELVKAINLVKVERNDSEPHLITVGPGNHPNETENVAEVPRAYKDPTQSQAKSVAVGDRLKPIHEKIMIQAKKKKEPRRCTICRSATHFKDKCPDRLDTTKVKNIQQNAV